MVLQCACECWCSQGLAAPASLSVPVTATLRLWTSAHPQNVPRAVVSCRRCPAEHGRSLLPPRGAGNPPAFPTLSGSARLLWHSGDPLCGVLLEVKGHALDTALTAFQGCDMGERWLLLGGPALHSEPGPAAQLAELPAGGHPAAILAEGRGLTRGPE